MRIFREARLNKDAADILKFSTCIENHSPFPQTDKIILVSLEVIEMELSPTLKLWKSRVK